MNRFGHRRRRTSSGLETGLDTIVFVGDSITDGDRRADARGLGTGYVGFVADALWATGDEVRIVNAGSPGDRVHHLQRRWRRDVARVRPTVISILVGVNDTVWPADRPTPPDEFERRYSDLLQRARGDAVAVVAVEPFLAAGTAGRGDLDAKRAIAERVARSWATQWVPVQAAIDGAARSGEAAVIEPDGIHLTRLGHRMLAELWLGAYRRLGHRP